MARMRGEADEGTVDPDLTPMLDLVLNVLMFFITTSKLVEEVKHPKVQLPESQVAIPLDPNVDKNDFMIITVDAIESANQRTNRNKMRHELRFDLMRDTFSLELDRPLIEGYLKEEYRKRSAAGGEVTTAIIIRADQEAEYFPLFDLMNMCKNAKFRKLKLRAWKVRE